jgi:hypothetical protein
MRSRYQAFDVVWPRDVDRKIVGPAQVRACVAGMIDRRDDKAGIGEYFNRVVMADEIARPAVRDDDQR